MTTDTVSVVASERALCGLILANPAKFEHIAQVISASDFSDARYKIIFESCMSLSKANDNWTWEVVADAIKSLEQVPLDLDTPINFISEIITNSPGLENLEVYVRQISDRKRRGKLIVAADRFKVSLSDPSKSTEELYKEIRSLEDHFVDTTFGKTRSVDSSNLWEELKGDIVELSEMPFIGTGFSSIDNHLSWGLAPGQVSLIAGKPSAGKSSFRMNMMYNLARQGIFTITISREQSLVQEYFRLWSRHSGYTLKKLVRVKDWGPEEEKVVKDSVLFMSKEKNFPHRIIDPQGFFFLSDAKRAVIKSQTAGENPRVVFIDLFDDLADFTQAQGNKNLARLIEEKLGEVADIGKELGVHFCLVCQLGRDVKGEKNINRNEKFKHSGGYEQKAFLAMQVERPGWGKDEIEDNCLVVRCTKQRDGELFRVELGWDPKTLTIMDKVLGDSGEDDGSFGAPF